MHPDAAEMFCKMFDLMEEDGAHDFESEDGTICPSCGAISKY